MKKIPKAMIVHGNDYFDDIVKLHETDLLNIRSLSIAPIKRSDGNLANKSYYLHSGYDWQIVKDSHGVDVLVPTEKRFGKDC